MWEQQSSIRIWAGTRLHPDLGAARLGQDLPGPGCILMLDCLYVLRMRALLVWARVPMLSTNTLQQAQIEQEAFQCTLYAQEFRCG